MLTTSGSSALRVHIDADSMVVLAQMERLLEVGQLTALVEDMYLVVTVEPTHGVGVSGLGQRACVVRHPLVLQQIQHTSTCRCQLYRYTTLNYCLFTALYISNKSTVIINIIQLLWVFFSQLLLLFVSLSLFLLAYLLILSLLLSLF